MISLAYVKTHPNAIIDPGEPVSHFGPNFWQLLNFCLEFYGPGQRMVCRYRDDRPRQAVCLQNCNERRMKRRGLMRCGDSCSDRSVNTCVTTPDAAPAREGSCSQGVLKLLLSSR